MTLPSPTSLPAEVTRLLDGCSAPRSALLRHCGGSGGRAPVLYIHGATFPTRLSVFWCLEGRSWADHLSEAGFDVWGLDFAGFGAAERHPAQYAASPEGEPLLRAAEAAGQVLAALRALAGTYGDQPVRLIAHSWGSMPACIAAAAAPERIAGLVLFGPIVRREGAGGDPVPGAWRPLTVAQQHARFMADVPPGHPHVLIEPDLARWGAAWLATRVCDRASPLVETPAGPAADIRDAWNGRLPYDPHAIHRPLLLARGSWDSLCTDADASWLLGRWGHGIRQDLRIEGGTHLMHLEQRRDALIAGSIGFLGALPR